MRAVKSSPRAFCVKLTSFGNYNIIIPRKFRRLAETGGFMEQKTQAQEVSLRRMLFSVGYRWKSIVAVAAILAVLLGGIQGVRTFRQMRSRQLAVQNNQISAEEENARLERRIELLEKNIADHKAFLAESLLMQIDPYHVYQAKALIYIAADDPDAVTNDNQEANTSALVNVYYTAANTQEMTELVAQAAGVDVLDLSELVNIYIQQDQNLQIAVYNPDAQIASQILSAYLDYLEEYQSKLGQSIAKHSYRVVFETVGLGESQSVRDKQSEARNHLTELEKALENLQKEYDGLRNPMQSVDAGTAAFKNGIKWAMLGVVAGAVLAVVVICFGFVCGDRISSSAELKCRFGIRELGGFWAGKRKCGFFSSKLMAAEGRISSNSEENLDLIAANIASFAQSGESVLITGSMQYPEFVAKLQQRLPDIKLVAGGSLIADAAAVRMLSLCQGVILLVKKGESRYSAVSREIDRVSDLDKRLIGCIIAEN